MYNDPSWSPTLPNKQQEAISEQIKEHERIAKEEARNRGRSVQEQQSTERSKRVTKYYCYHCETELTKLSPKVIKGLAVPIYKPRYGCHSCKEQYTGWAGQLISTKDDRVEAIVSTLEIP